MDVYELLRQEARSKKAGEPNKEQYARIEIDLDTAREDEEIHIAGNQITMAFCDGNATTTYFKLNHRHSRKVYPAEIEKLLGNFGGIYLTNAAEAGKKLVIYVGRDIFIFPARSGATRILKADCTTIDPAVESEYETVLGEIKTAVEFSGSVYSEQQTSTNAMVAIGTYKLRDVIIKNTAAANAIDIGMQKGSVADFRADSYELGAGAVIGFTQVNLATLFILSSIADSHGTISLLGTKI